MRRIIIAIALLSVCFSQQTYLSEIQPIWDNSCTSSCHNVSNPSGGLKLLAEYSYSELVNVASQGWPTFSRVKPSDAMNSVLHQKIVGNTSFGDRMPKGGTLSQAEEDKIKKWIDQGAPQDWSGGTTSSYSFDFGGSSTANGASIGVIPPIKGEPNWSIETWVKFHEPPSTGTVTFLMNYNNQDPQNLKEHFYLKVKSMGFGVFEWEVFISENPGTQVEVTRQINFINNSLFDEKWHHIFIHSGGGGGSELEIRFDGVQVAAVDYPAGFPNRVDDIFFFGVPFDGLMDEIRFRKDAPLFTEVPIARYNAEKGTKLLFQFDELSTTEVKDNSGFNNNGAFISMQGQNAGPAKYGPDVYGGGGGTGKQNTIEIVARLNQDIGVGDVHVGVWLPGNNGNPNFVGNADGKNSPSPNEGWGFEIKSSSIMPSDGPYKIEAFFDQNNNDTPDGNELFLLFQDIYTDDQGYAFVDMTLGGGDNQQQILNVSLSVDGVDDGINGQVIIDLLSSGEQIIQGFQFGETTPITNMKKSFNVTSQVSQNAQVFLRGWYRMGINDANVVAEGESNVFNWPPTGDISLVLEKGGTYTGSFKTNITVHSTNESGSLSFRILPQGSLIKDYFPDFIGAEYSYDHLQVFSTPPSDQEIEINDFLIDVPYGMYPFVAWYNVDSDNGFDPAQDPFSAGQINIAKDQDLHDTLTPLSRLPGPDIITNNLIGLTANEDEALTLTINVNKHPGMFAGPVDQVNLIYHRGDWDGNFGWTGPSNSNEDPLNFVIDAGYLTSAGLVIGIEAFDLYGANSYAGPYDVAVQFDSIYIASVVAEYYTMISVPANLSNPSLMNVLGDELGEADATQWRSFRWLNGAYQENVGSLTPGSAVWLISKENVSAIHASSGYSTSLLSGTTISLSNGWNQIGNPYNFSMDIHDSAWNVVDFSSEVEKILYVYSGEENYSQTTKLDPGTGYWVYSNGSGRIQIIPMQGFSGPPPPTSSPNITKEAQEGWLATLEVVAGNQKDKATIFGMHPEASDGYDKKDFHEPPVIGEYISAYFNHPEAGNLNNDMRSESQDVTRWPLSVITNQKGRIEMTIPDIDGIPNYYEVRLYDPISKIVYNMRQDNHVKIASQGSENPYHLELILGSFNGVEEQLKMMDVIPSTFELAQNIPNPFNPVTNIRVSVIEDAKITLKVYNILGEELNALAINQSLGKGNHRFIWAGKDDHGHQLPSGIYLYRLEVMSQSGNHLYQDTKKMILMK